MESDGKPQYCDKPVDDNIPACPACGSDALDTSPGELGVVCTSCGTVVSSNTQLDRPQGVEDEEIKSPDWTDHYSVSNSTEQQVASAFAFLEELSDELTISDDIRTRAAEIYGKAAIEMITDGRPMDAVVAGAIILAAREHDHPHPLGRVAELANVNVCTLRRTLSALRSNLCLYPFCSPTAYLPGLVPLLELDDSTVPLARQILSDLPSNRIGGKHPAAVAGASLYLAASGQITQRDVAQATGVTTETVRLRVMECRETSPTSVQRRIRDNGE